MLISSQPFTHNHHSVMRKQMTFCKRSIVQYLSVTNKDFFKIWEMLKHDFRFLHEIIIVSGGRGVSSVLSTYTKLTFFFFSSGRGFIFRNIKQLLQITLDGIHIFKWRFASSGCTFLERTAVSSMEHQCPFLYPLRFTTEELLHWHLKLYISLSVRAHRN